MSVKTFLFLLTSALSLAQPSIGAAAFTRKAVVYSACTVSNTVALTFDDGPYKYMTDISDLLVNKSAKGTFFVNGNNYDCIYDTKVAARLQYTYSSGHQICSHTYSHPDLTTLDENEIAGEFAQIDLALMKILGVATPFLRPPFGSYNNLVREVAFQQNKSLVLWDFDSQDSLNATVAESEGYYDAIIKSNPSTILALNHETESKPASPRLVTHTLIGYAVDALQAANYSLVTVAECLGLEPYTFVGSLGQRDASGPSILLRCNFLTLPYRLHGFVRMTMMSEKS
ncbi:carbohydrate esterase family 4 protein [Mycena capillaripes]|nr:carbohydrate esterase family 4 protein [Mycena capillaripes]